MPRACPAHGHRAQDRRSGEAASSGNDEEVERHLRRKHWGGKAHSSGKERVAGTQPSSVTPTRAVAVFQWWW
jgi:hypothetical protein